MHRARRSAVTPIALIALMVGCGGGASTVADPSRAGTGAEGEAAARGAPAALIVGGDHANFGTHALSAGVMPDPATVDVLSGGDLDASAADTDGATCAGWVTAQPDVIVHLEEMEGFLRFAFRPNVDGEDATLVINDGEGNWYCNDDGAGLNPVVDLQDAPAGHYDIWIGSYAAGTNVEGQLLITELSDVIP